MSAARRRSWRPKLDAVTSTFWGADFAQVIQALWLGLRCVWLTSGTGRPNFSGLGNRLTREQKTHRGIYGHVQSRSRIAIRETPRFVV